MKINTHKTRYCIGCHAEQEHFWNTNQREFECKQCGLLALDEQRRPDHVLMEFFESQGVNFDTDTVVISNDGSYKIHRNTHTKPAVQPDEY